MARRASARNAPSNEVVALNTSRELPSEAERTGEDPRIAALPDSHGHAKGEHKPFAEERPIPYTARMLFLWFFHACRRGRPRFMMVADHINYLTFEDPAAVNLVRRALKLAQAGDLYGAAETAGVDVAHAAVVSEGLRRGMRYSIGAEVDNDPRSRPDAQNIVDAMRPDGMVRSVHFLPIVHPQHGEWMWPYDNPEFVDLFDVVGIERTWELYMATLLDAIDKLPGHIIGHFYAPGKFGHWPDEATLETYEDRFLDACAERGMAVEVNARYFYKAGADVDEASLERYRVLHARLLRKAKAKNVAVAVGSDAHSPKDQGRAFDEVLALLDGAEINEIAFPINGRLARVALRATDETRAVAAESASARAASLASIPTDDDEDDDAPIAGLPPAASAPPDVAAAPAPVAAAPAPARKRPSRTKPKVEASMAADPPEGATLRDAAPPHAAATAAEAVAPSAAVAEPPPAEASVAAPAPTAVEPSGAAPSGAEPTEAAPSVAEPSASIPAEPEPATAASPGVEASNGVVAPSAAKRRTPRKAASQPSAEPPAPEPVASPSELAATAPRATVAARATATATPSTSKKAGATGKPSPAAKSVSAAKPAAASKRAPGPSAPATVKTARASKAVPATKATTTKRSAPTAARKPAATAAKATAKRTAKPASKAAAKKSVRPATTRPSAKKKAAKAAPARKAAKRAPAAKRAVAKRPVAKKSPAKKSAAKKTGKARR